MLVNVTQRMMFREIRTACITKDGGTLRTIREACDYMTTMGRKRELRTHWQRACKLILAKADVSAVSRALELALFMDGKLDVSKVPAK
jgi:hypothetical protein